MVAVPAAAQDSACGTPPGVGEQMFKGFKNSVALPPCPDPTLPPVTSKGTPDKAPPVGAPPAGPREQAEYQLPSTDLGFEPGIGPAPGYGVTWHGRQYIVVDVTTKDGRPTFAGGSRFIITTEGGALDIGLKSLGKNARLPEMANAAPVLN